MKLRRLLQTCTLLLPIAVIAAAPAQNLQRNFSVSTKTDIPGETLSPGIYSIRIVDHLTDRTVVRIANTDGGKPTTFLAVNGSSLPGGDGPVLWAQGTEGRKAFRGFRFPSGPALEFVYPKASAVALAKANADHVVAIDPASEGRSEAKLSGDDLQLVNLWTLSPVKVGPEDGIKAQKYQEVASAETHPDLLQRSTAGTAAVSAAPSRSVASAQPTALPRPRPRPVINRLPKTGSPVSVVYLLGLCSLAGAGFLRYSRS